MSTIGGPDVIENGLVLGYDADDRSTRFYPGEPTTNLCDNFTNLYGYWNNSGVLTVNTNDTNLSRLFKGVNVFSGTVTTAGQQHISPGGCNITPNTTYTVSVYLFIEGNTTFDIQPYIRPQPDNNFAGNLAYKGSTNWTTWPKNQWIRIEGTFTASATATSVYISSYIGTAVGHKIYYTAPQIEAKSHATQFIAGSRSVTSSLIDLNKTTNLDLSNVSFDSTAHPTFDGSDAIVIPHNNIFNFTTLTCLMWVNPVYAETYQFRGFIGKYGADRDFNFYAYSISNNNIFDYVHFSTSRLTSYDSFAMLPNALTNGKWHQLGFTIGDGYLKYIYNGEIIKSSAYTGTFNANNSYNLYIGAADNYWIGKLSNILLYNRILTTQEIKNSFNTCKSRFSI